MKQAALDAGCIEFIQKPLARTTAEMQSFAQTICRAVKSAYDLHGDHSKAEEPEVVHTSFSTTAKRFRKMMSCLHLALPPEAPRRWNR